MSCFHLFSSRKAVSKIYMGKLGDIRRCGSAALDLAYVVWPL